MNTNDETNTPLNTFEGMKITITAGQYDTVVAEVTEPNRVRAILATLISLNGAEYIDALREAEANAAVEKLNNLREAVTSFGEKKGAPTA